MAFEASSRRIGSMAVNLLRLIVAMLILGMIGLVNHTGFIPTHATAHQWKWLLISGFVGFFVGDLALFRGFVLIGARLMTLLMVLAAPFAAVIGYFWLGETLSLPKIIGMMLSLGGVAWVCLERNADSTTPRHHVTWGITLGVIAALGQGLGAVLTKIGKQDLDAFSTTQVRLITGIVGFMLAIPLMRRSGDVIRGVRDSRAMAFLSLGALAGPALGVSSLNAALARIPVGIAQTLASMVPVMIIPFAIWLRHEKVSARAIVGALIAVSGVAILCLSN